MSNSITNCSPRGVHFPIGMVCVGERDKLFSKIQHCFFIVTLNLGVALKAVFTFFSTSPVQMQSCIVQLSAFKEMLENCDVANRGQREQLSAAYAELPQYIKSKFARLCHSSCAHFVESGDEQEKEECLEKFLRECKCVIAVQKALIPARNFFSRSSDRVNSKEEINLDQETDSTEEVDRDEEEEKPVVVGPNTNPRIKLEKEERSARNSDPFVLLLSDAHRARAKQIAAMTSILDILTAKNIDVRTQKLKDEGDCLVKLETMQIPVYPYTEAYNGALHRFDLEYYLYDGKAGSLAGDAFMAALVSKPNFKCTACRNSPNACVPAGREPSTVLKVDTAFQKMIVNELVRSFAKLSKAQIVAALQEKRSEIQALELSSKGEGLSKKQEKQKMQAFVNDFPNALKQRMQNILQEIYKKE